MPSIHDVAKYAKVSSATVSRVLTGGIASSAAKAKVLKAVKKINYQPDARGKALRTGRTDKIGLILPDVSNPTYAITAKLVHDYIRGKKYSLSLGCTYSKAKEEIFLLESMQREHVTGLIISSNEGAQASELPLILNRILKAKIPVVLLGKKVKGFAADQVSVDNVDGMRQIGHYLSKVGRRRLGFIAGARNLLATEERLRGLRQGLNSCKCNTKLVRICCSGAYSRENGQILAQKLLADKQVDAIVCGNDLMALGAIKACTQLGFQIPKEIAITGFDNSFVAEIANPPLTTVMIPQQQVIETACDLLFARINGTAPKRSLKKTLPCHLIVRQST